MGFTFRPADEAAVRAFWGWRYEAPYDVYNADADGIEEGVRYFLDPEINCYAICDEKGELMAFCTFGSDGQVPGGNYDADACGGAEGLDIGLGMRPDLTGQGLGFMYVDAVVDFARRTFGVRPLRVTVAAFNQRALRVWKKAGLRTVERFERRPDGMAFVVLVRDE